MNSESNQCRREGCSEQSAPFSVFCNIHHTDELQRQGVVLPDRSAAGDLQKLWKLYVRQIIVEQELTNMFFDAVEPENVIECYTGIPARYQELVRARIDQFPAMSFPPPGFLGPGPSDEVRARLHATLLEAAWRLKNWLKR